MDFTTLIDIVDEAEKEIGDYEISMTLAPKNLKFDNFLYDTITWQSVRYSEDEIDQVPNDKRGVYAFAICHESPILPPHSYILYIGIAGRDSDRSLRDRYLDYFNVKKVAKRGGLILRMIAKWNEVLRFYYFPVDENVSSDDLKLIEQQLNTSLLPPFSKGDIDAETKRKQRILQK